MKKWHKFRASKAMFPTRVVNNGNKGVLHVGHIEAKSHLEAELGRSLKDAVLGHTRSEWIFKFLIGSVPPRIAT